jgi:hypothetical protein
MTNFLGPLFSAGGLILWELELQPDAMVFHRYPWGKMNLFYLTLLLGMAPSRLHPEEKSTRASKRNRVFPSDSIKAIIVRNRLSTNELVVELDSGLEVFGIQVREETTRLRTELDLSFQGRYSEQGFGK